MENKPEHIEVELISKNKNGKYTKKILKLKAKSQRELNKLKDDLGLNNPLLENIRC